jgi:hypothetical protein
MLRGALESALVLGGLERVVTIASDPYGAEDGATGAAELRPGRTIVQPRDCGTCPALFLGLAYALDRDPDAVVVVLTADRSVEPRDLFHRYALTACYLARQVNGVFLLAAKPRGARDNPDACLPSMAPMAMLLKNGSLRAMNDAEGRPLAEGQPSPRGGLWATAALAARAMDIWRLGAALVPQMMGRFEAFLTTLREIRRGETPASEEARALWALYHDLEPMDLAPAILARSSAHITVLALEGVEESGGRGSSGHRTARSDRLPIPFPGRTHPGH